MKTVVSLLRSGFVCLALIAACGVGAPNALAAPAPAASGGGCIDANSVVSPQSVQAFSASVTGPITNLSSTIQSTALGMSNAAQTYGRELGGAFALLTVLFDIMIAMTRKQSIIEPVVGTIIMAMTAAFLLYQFPTVIGFVVGETQAISTSVAGTADPLSLIGPAFGNMVVGLFQPMVQTINANCGWIAIGTHLGSIILVLFVSIVALFFVLLAFVELIAITVMPILALGIGTAIGPVMVGLIASRWTQKWFLKWLEFMLAAAILNLLVCVALSLLSKLFGAIGTAAISGSGAVVASLGMMVLSLALGKFFQSIPGMASAMVPGHHGMSAGGGSAVGAATTEMASQAKTAGGGAGGVAAAAAAPTKIASAMAPMRVAAAAIGGSAAVAAVGMMTSTAEAATRGAKAIASGVGATSSGTSAGAQNSPAMASLAENLSGGGGATVAPPMAGGGGGATAASTTSAVGGPAAVDAANRMAEMARSLASDQGATASPPPPES